MLKVYAYLFSALVMCLGASAWVINTQLNVAPIATSAELTLARTILTSNSYAHPEWADKVMVKPAHSVHFEQNIAEQRDPHHIFISIVFYASVAVAVMLVSWPLLRDLNRLRQASKAIYKGDFSAQASLGKFSVIKRIGDSFDEMARALRDQSDYQRQLINAVSHDFLTPISRAKFALEISKEAAQSKLDSNSVLQDMTELEMLVEEFLTYAELNQCRPAIRPSMHHARNLLEHGCDKFRIYSDIDIEIHCHCETIEVDRRSFMRILQNLMSNSVRFATSTIHVHLADKPHGIELTVEDDGPGFSEKFTPKLLHAFVKNHQVAQREQTGVGLGLSIVSKLCAWNDADIDLGCSDTLGGASVRIVF